MFVIICSSFDLFWRSYPSNMSPVDGMGFWTELARMKGQMALHWQKMTALSVCIPSYFILFLSQQISPSVKPNHSRLLPLDVDHRPLHSIHLIPFLMSPLMLILDLCRPLLLLLLPVFPVEDDDDDNDIVHIDYYIIKRSFATSMLLLLLRLVRRWWLFLYRNPGTVTG